MAHYLSVAQVYEQADVVPSAADAHVRQVAARVRARGAPPKAPRHDVGRIGLVGLAGMDLEFLPAVGARQAVFPMIRQILRLLTVLPDLASAAFILREP